jgi:nickel-dependent lactate racemase
MSSKLRFGLDRAIELDLPPTAVRVECATPRRCGDAAADTADALREPLDFPPLRQATVPGDRVALALAAGVPQADAVIAALVANLLDSGVDPHDITIVRTSADVAAEVVSPVGKLPAETARCVAVRVHDPADRNALALLGYTRAGREVYFSRALCEADLVVPVGCLRPDADLASGDAVGECLYPAFSDEKTLTRLHSAALTRRDSAAAGGEAHEAGWLLGAQFTVQVVPGPDGQALHVLAGQGPAVCDRGQRLSADAWRATVPARADLVVAAISGDATQQTWANLGRALETAGRLVAERGAIAICCNLSASPGPAVECLARAEEPWDTVRRLRRESPPDLHVAEQITRALESSRVYLLSRLDDSLVEDLGMTPVSDTPEIVRLIQRSPSSILLADAQYSQAVVAE